MGFCELRLAAQAKLASMLATSRRVAITASGSLFRDDVGVPDRSLGGLAESVSRVAWSPADVRVMDTDESLIGAAVRVTVNLLTAEVC